MTAAVPHVTLDPAPVSATELLMVAEDLRVDVDDVPSCDGLAFRTRGQRVLVLGAPRALFEAATALSPVKRGALTIRGTAAPSAVAKCVIAGAAMDPPLPPRWSVREYVQWSARLAGVPATEARSSAEAAIAKLQLQAMTNTLTSKLVPHARRATVVAAALATYAEIIALEDPLGGGLADESAAAYAKILATALEDRAWILFAPRMPLTSPLAMAADEAILVSAGSRVDAQGTPAMIASATRRFVGRIHGAAAAIEPELSARGARLDVQGAHVYFDLGPDMTTGELITLCASRDVTVVELLPIARALS